MGPKKKGKSKGEKKKKTAPEVATNAEPEVKMEEGTKGFYLTQIESLRKKVSGLQDECDCYLVSQQANADRLETLKEIRVGSRAYIGRQMDEINLQINHLNRQLRELDELKIAEENELVKQIKELREKDLQETVEKNKNENNMLKAKLNALDDLRSRKESLLNEINQLDEQLKQQEHNYQEDIYYREKDAVLEKDKLRKEMLARVNDLSSEFRRVSKMQVVQTTRQIILENVRLNNRMSVVEKDYTSIEERNGTFRDEKKNKSLEYSLLDERERMMEKKNRKTYQLIEKLANECAANENFITNLEEKISTFSYTEQLVDELEELNRKADKRRDQAIEENELLRKDIAQQENILLQYENDVNKAKTIVDRTVQSLEDVLRASSGATNTTGRLIDNRICAFQNILQLLNVATELGIGPKLNELAAKSQTDSILFSKDDQDVLSSPTQPLAALKKLKTRSIAVQTSISNRFPLPYNFKTARSSSPTST